MGERTKNNPSSTFSIPSPPLGQLIPSTPLFLWILIAPIFHLILQLNAPSAFQRVVDEMHKDSPLAHSYL